MSAAPVTEADLQAFVDGRLPDARLADIEAYLAARPEEEARLAAYRSHNDALRGLHAMVLAEPVPEFLLYAARPREGRLRRIASACALVALGVLAGWQLGDLRVERDTSAEIARSAAIAHVTYSPEVRHPVEVGVDQEAHLVAWLSKRLGTALRAPKLDAEGYSLVGGRLLPGDKGSHPVAQFMYQCKLGTRLTLYVRAEAPDQGETAFRYVREGNVGVFYWIDRNFGYALSSADIAKDDLLKVANDAYRQLNP